MKIALVVDGKLNIEMVKSSRFINIGICLAKENLDVTLVGVEPDKEISGLGNSKLKVVTIPHFTSNSKSIMTYAWQRRLFKWLVMPWKLAIKLKEINPDCVYFRGLWLATCIGPFLKWRKKKVMYDFHGLFSVETVAVGKKIPPLFTLLQEKITLKTVDRIIAVSQGVMVELPEKYITKTILLPNGINIDRYKKKVAKAELDNIIEKYNIHKNKKKVCFVGLWTPWYVVEDVVRSVDYLHDVQILIIGEGENIQELKRKYDHPLVIFTGQIEQDEVTAFYKLVDIMVVPYADNIYKAKIPGWFQARKVKEIIAQGKPIIVSDIIGKDPFLKEGENALFYKPGQPDDMAKKIEQLLNDPGLYNKICSNNLLLAKELSWGKIVQKSNLIGSLHDCLNEISTEPRKSIRNHETVQS